MAGRGWDGCPPAALAPGAFVPRTSSSSSFVPIATTRNNKHDKRPRSIPPPIERRSRSEINNDSNNMADDHLKRRRLPSDSECCVSSSSAAASASISAPPPSAGDGKDDGKASPSSSSSPAAASRAIDFLTLTRSLKTTKRTGWVRSGVSRPESIADHMYRMSLMAMIASRDANNANASACARGGGGGDDDDDDDRRRVVINADRCVRLAMVHDLAEATVGDITPHCGVSDAEKYARELAAMETMRDVLGPTLGGDEFLELWREYEEGETDESKLVKDLDKVEMILQALEYEAEGDHETSLDGFFDGTAGKWRTEIGRAWAEEIVSRRRRASPAREKNNTPPPPPLPSNCSR
ncbi:hypothetical protein ACHAW5_004289 [Stephanodiscus triporus]|uniref:5'-deoxynucleotidase n=1 Tax=Stephanodiscus triporus TaxID=2934178 RepID=A0ABD3MX43_9STRA